MSALIRRHLQWLPIAAIALAFIGITVFTKGFLQVRKMMEDKSECESPPVHNVFFPRRNDNDCWVPSSHKKLIIVVIDALRIDFTLPSRPENSLIAAWYDKLTVLNDLAKKQPRNSHIFHFIADPPTATTQRLSGLTAGTLPVFIEVTSNFAENMLSSDNFIHQLLKRNRTIDMLGDDTWLHLFPEIRKQSNSVVAGFHSFHLFDLDTVDNGIKAAMFPRLESGKYDIMIAHFLGVDHCGHKFGPAHFHCGEKLREMDDVLRKIIELMDSGSQLFVLGDHGMTDNGDHGGISDKEVGSVLFSFAKNDEIAEEDSEFWDKFGQRLNSIRMTGNNIGNDSFFKKSCDDSSLTGVVPQLDFTSTLSLLAGISIPFGNIGSIIPELLIDFGKYKSMPIQEARIYNLRYIVDAIRVNAFQVRKFLVKSHTVGQSGFEIARIRPLLDKLAFCEKELQQADHNSDVDLDNVIFLYYDFLLSVQKHCRSVWADFDMVSILSGLALGVVSISGLYCYFLWSNMVDFGSLFALGLSLLHSVSLATTSFIVFEDSVVRFLLISILSQEGYQSFISGTLPLDKLLRIILAIIIVRLTSLTGACREEQFPYCEVVVHRSVPADHMPQFILFVILGLFGLGWTIRVCHESLKELKNSAKFLLGQCLYFATIVLIGIHWLWTWIIDTTESAGDTNAHPLFTQIMNIALPRLLIVLSIFSAIVYRNNRTLLLTAISILAGTVSRPFGGWSTLVAGLALFRLASMLFTDHTKPAIFYYLAGMHLFFISGHQMTLTNLQWEAAFVGVKYTIHAISAILMALNTFSGPILAVLAISFQSSHSRLIFLWYAASQMVLAALFTANLMRHLMVWKIFTPRFLLQIAMNLIILVILGIVCFIKPKL